jgi:putative ABC transport system permease protein
MAIFDSVRREVWATDRGVALTFSSTLENYLNSESYAGPRFGFILMSVFAAVGLVLVSIGVYSVVSYATARRTHEIGIRMALGASPADALKLILGGGMRVIGLGVLIGFVVSLTLSRMLATQMWQVSVHDPATIAGVTILLLATGAVASFLPAQRATSIAPTTALRHD